jgi:hypothetical protein
MKKPPIGRLFCCLGAGGAVRCRRRCGLPQRLSVARRWPRRTGLQLRVELGHARRQQHDHGGAVVEARHLGELVDADVLAAPVLAGDLVAVGGDLFTAPHRFHATDQQRADHHLHHRPEGGVEVADQALVAGKQARHVGYRIGAHAEQAARDVHGFTQGAGNGHVHAVVVARGQVDGGKQAVVVRLGVLRIAQQLGGGERLALGLEDAAVLDRAQLADAAVGWHQQGAAVRVGTAGTRLERAGEEGIEAGVGTRVRVGRLAQVDLELLRHSVDQQLRGFRVGGVGHAPGQR